MIKKVNDLRRFRNNPKPEPRPIPPQPNPKPSPPKPLTEGVDPTNRPR